MVPLQFLGGLELLFILFWLVLSLVPFVLFVVVVYWLYKIRTDVAAIRDAVESGGGFGGSDLADEDEWGAGAETTRRAADEDEWAGDAGRFDDTGRE